MTGEKDREQHSVTTLLSPPAVRSGKERGEKEKAKGRGVGGQPAQAPIEHVLAVTPLTALGPDIFTNAREPWHPQGARGIFGGAVIALCLSAAQATMPSSPPSLNNDPFAPHSFHCYFLLAGQTGVPIILHVERVRDGRTFATRTVQARQLGRCIFTMTVSFARMDEYEDLPLGGAGHGSRSSSNPPFPGKKKTLSHSYPMPKDVAIPTDARKEVSESNPAPFGGTDVEIVRMVTPAPPRHSSSPSAALPHQFGCRRWVRARGRISEEGGTAAHLAALAYMSDSQFLGTSARVHVAARGGAQRLPRSKETEENEPVEIGMLVSLDHAMYFHAPRRVRADEWMLMDMESGWTGDGRGLVSERIYAADGTLLATCVQEGVVRLKEKGEAKL